MENKSRKSGKKHAFKTQVASTPISPKTEIKNYSYDPGLILFKDGNNDDPTEITSLQRERI